MNLKKDRITLFVEYLKKNHKTIATMESCTGGYIANVITNVIGASDVFQFGAVTYSNETKIKMGVSKEIIDTYSVYSNETAIEMATVISKQADADYGIGITGILNSPEQSSMVYIAIYDAQKKTAHHYTLSAEMSDRQDNKIIIANFIFDRLLELFVMS